ncbi:MAG: PKD domain-containing protein, partial [Methanosarcina sp.]
MTGFFNQCSSLVASHTGVGGRLQPASRVLLSLALLLSATGVFASDLTLTWDAVNADGLSGYKLHYGTVSANYSNAIVASTNRQTVTGLESGKTYYFAVQAQSVDSTRDSNFSHEFSTTIPYPAPEAAFTANEQTGQAPLLVAFTDTSTGQITSWKWEFGDGTSSTERSPTHLYTNPGTYNVILTVTGPGGAAQISAAGFIQVKTAPPVAAFNASVTSGVAPASVSFANASTGDIKTYLWTFGDGGQSTAANAVWT